MLLICSDETFYEVRFGREFIDGLGDEWASFLTMSDQSRAIIVETLGDMDNRNPYIRYYRESVKEVTDRWKSRNVRHTEMRELLEISNGTEE